MLYAILLCAIISVVAARPKDQQVHKITPELVLKVQKYTLPCIEKYNADPDIFNKLLQGTMGGDDASKNFLYCFTVSANFTDVEGHFNIKRMATLLENHPLVKPFEEALTECNKVTKETPIETIFHLRTCLDETSPVVFSL